jgi:uncharacterized membrane protein
LVTGLLRTIRWRSVILVLSLAVNLFFAGLFVTRHAFGPLRGPDSMLARLIGELGAHLSDPDRAILQRVFDTHEAEIKQRSAQAMRSRAGIRAAMVAEPFDPAALTAAVDEASARDQAMRRAIERMLLEAATQVSPDGRGKLAAWRPLQH